MSELLQALVLVTLAELGDKTQLMALAFAARYPIRTVIAGIVVAIMLVTLFSAGLGGLLGAALPRDWITLGAGVAFLGFGVWTLRGKDEDDHESTSSAGRLGPFLTVVLTFFLAEMGDKTMLATVALASHTGALVSVWIGSTLGLLLADGLAIAAGAMAGRALPRRLIRLLAGGLFILSGLFVLLELFRPAA
jgi:putative Ca2+/H+ antiporter (TMEM165/GDT1 family)